MDDDNKVDPDLKKQIEEADAKANESGEVSPPTLDQLILDDHDEYDGPLLPTEKIAAAAAEVAKDVPPEIAEEVAKKIEKVIDDAAIADKLAQDPPPDIDLKALTDAAYDDAEQLQEKSEEALKVVGSQKVDVSAVADGTIRRNGPCPCGSGRKFKKCCLGDVRSGEFRRIKAFDKKTKELPYSGHEEPRAIQKKRRYEAIKAGARRIPHMFTKLARPGQGMVLEDWGFRKRELIQIEPDQPTPTPEEDPTVD